MSPAGVEPFFGSIFPRVEDPLPESIGLGFPFALAGAGGLLAGVIYVEASPARRNRAINLGGLAGFGVGVAIYLLSLLIQVVLNP